jgi:hypothetical protein
VDANRLRARLGKYYRNEGKHSRIQICLPKGQYAPEFRRVCSWSDDGSAHETDGTASETPARLAEAEQLTSAPLCDVSQPAVTAPVASVGTLNDGRLEHASAWRSRRVLLPLVIPVAIVIFLVVLMSVRPQPGATSPPDTARGQSRSEKSDEAVPVAAPARSDTVRILAGSGVPRYVDQFGKVWAGDRFFTGGRAEESMHPPLIYAGDRQIWRRYRGGDFQYDIPLKPGIYELHLYFSEPIYGVDELHGGGETTRLFDLTLNNRPLLKSFDITSSAGGALTADVKVFTDVSPDQDGLLRLKFTSVDGPAVVNAIEVIPGAKGRMQPLRIATRNVPFFSEDQTFWSADQYFWGGRGLFRQFSITGTDKPELYNSERFGNFSYKIPVSSGRYTARLHFVEVYFGPNNAGGGGEGMRVFNVHCNGATLLKDFDLYREAGGANKALVKEFRGLEPDPQSNLVFDFQPVKNYACVTAIEILPES